MGKRLQLAFTEPTLAPMPRSMSSSVRQSFNTPPGVIAVIRQFDTIGLDPCSNADSIVGAAAEWRLERDGDSLVKAWTGHGLVYVNPPYSRWLKKWMAKCSMSGAEVISLTPARTDTKAWHSFASTADAVCFWKGRMKFLNAKNMAPFPSALCYWQGDAPDSRVEKFTAIFSRFGIVMLKGRGAVSLDAERNSQIALAL